MGQKTPARRPRLEQQDGASRVVTKDTVYTFDAAVHEALGNIVPAFQHSVGLDGALPKSLEAVTARSLDEILEVIERKAEASAIARELSRQLKGALAQLVPGSELYTKLAALAAEIEASMDDPATARGLIDKVNSLTAQVATESSQQANQQARWNELWGKAEKAWNDADKYISQDDKDKMEELDKQLKAAIARGDTAEVERLEKAKAKLMIETGQKIEEHGKATGNKEEEGAGKTLKEKAAEADREREKYKPKVADITQPKDGTDVPNNRIGELSPAAAGTKDTDNPGLVPL